ncbi:uncharacterized protein MONOS_6196 [Monocercomonoides exilis]|uniref:uncharacterized protein n=1 Tax=Monocercomonoides exilis TaxID=2049356 RepID=UPI003559E136|nr:hypothetical protein MONOS_6196 [Monocercomonoides exilis]|eukprot:MONOS_6196.1-p1 / transcript=MONOS_6196.1 / gene=MONOS_6196 / organism=Monocercomonoides_exilis_PA203 / gene_product=unspecified product / transcript_product=unspecified product / location=Mono_scaffold00192:20370-23476(+) / protein_length=826 / sequence_SO=supercontig / SO=protein_coding / is_pseudo=false
MERLRSADKIRSLIGSKDSKGYLQRKPVLELSYIDAEIGSKYSRKSSTSSRGTDFSDDDRSLKKRRQTRGGYEVQTPEKKLVTTFRDALFESALQGDAESSRALQAAETKPSSIPPHSFCSICGFNASYTCTVCSARYCSLQLTLNEKFLNRVNGDCDQEKHRLKSLIHQSKFAMEDYCDHLPQNQDMYYQDNCDENMIETHISKGVQFVLAEKERKALREQAREEIERRRKQRILNEENKRKEQLKQERAAKKRERKETNRIKQEIKEKMEKTLPKHSPNHHTIKTLLKRKRTNERIHASPKAPKKYSYQQLYQQIWEKNEKEFEEMEAERYRMLKELEASQSFPLASTNDIKDNLLQERQNEEMNEKEQIDTDQTTDYQDLIAPSPVIASDEVSMKMTNAEGAHQGKGINAPTANSPAASSFKQQSSPVMLSQTPSSPASSYLLSPSSRYISSPHAVTPYEPVIVQNVTFFNPSASVKEEKEIKTAQQNLSRSLSSPRMLDQSPPSAMLSPLHTPKSSMGSPCSSPSPLSSSLAQTPTHNSPNSSSAFPLSPSFDSPLESTFRSSPRSATRSHSTAAAAANVKQNESSILRAKAAQEKTKHLEEREKMEETLMSPKSKKWDGQINERLLSAPDGYITSERNKEIVKKQIEEINARKLNSPTFYPSSFYPSHSSLPPLCSTDSVFTYRYMEKKKAEMRSTTRTALNKSLSNTTEPTREEDKKDATENSEALVKNDTKLNSEEVKEEENQNVATESSNVPTCGAEEAVQSAVESEKVSLSQNVSSIGSESGDNVCFEKDNVESNNSRNSDNVSSENSQQNEAANDV